MKKQFKFERCNCVITDRFIHRQRTMINEQKNANNQKKFAIAIKNDDKNRFNSSNIKQNQSNQQNKIKKKNHAFSKNRKNIDTMQKSSKIKCRIFTKNEYICFAKKCRQKFYLNTNREIMK